MLTKPNVILATVGIQNNQTEAAIVVHLPLGTLKTQTINNINAEQQDPTMDVPGINIIIMVTALIVLGVAICVFINLLV